MKTIGNTTDTQGTVTMATTEHNCKSDARQILTAVRLLAQRAGVGKVGPEYVLAAALGTLDPDRARTLLTSVGVGDPDEVLARVPRVDLEQLGHLEAVKPDAPLADLLRDELSGIVTLKVDAEWVVTVLLRDVNRTKGIERFLTDPRSGAPGVRDYDRDGTAFLLKGLSVFYARRWQLGRAYHMPQKKSGLSDFADGKCDEAYHRAVDDLQKEQVKVYRDLFAHPVYDRSLLGRCWRELGDVAAHTLGLVLLGEIGQVGDGPLSCREVAWSLSPRSYHRALGLARRTLNQLYEKDWVQSISGGDVSYLGEAVVPTPETLDEFLDFLRREDPIRDSEVVDLLATLY